MFAPDRPQLPSANTEGAVRQRVQLHIDSLYGPLVPVALRPEPERAEMLRNMGRDVPTQVQGWGLIDTGARQTCIDERMAHRLYQQVGVAQTYTPSTQDSEPHEAPVYYGLMAFPGTPLPQIEQTMLGMALGYTVQGGTVVALLGRDWLAGLRMIYDGPTGQLDIYV